MLLRVNGVYEFFSDTEYPFTAIMYIENALSNTKSFTIEVRVDVRILLGKLFMA